MHCSCRRQASICFIFQRSTFNLENLKTQSICYEKLLVYPIHVTNPIYLLRNCFSNYVYLKDTHITEWNERNWKNSVCIGVKKFENSLKSLNKNVVKQR